MADDWMKDLLPATPAAPAGLTPAATAEPTSDWQSSLAPATAIQDSFKTSWEINPDTAAKVSAIAAKTGIHPAIINNNLPEYEKLANSPDFYRLNDLNKTNPRTAAYLEHPRNMALSKDNVDSLQGHEDVLADHGVLGNILASTGAAFNAVPLAAARLPALAMGLQSASMPGQPQVPEILKHNSVTSFLESNESWYRNQSMQDNFLDEIGKGNMGHATAALYSQFVAPMIPLVMASMMGQPELGLGMFGAQTAGEGMKSGEAAGLSDAQAAGFGAVKGSVMMAAGKMGDALASVYGSVASKYGAAMGRQAVGRLAVKASEAMLGSGSTMATMTAADKILGYATGVDPHGMDNFAKDVLTSAAGGALVPAIGVPFGVMRARNEERQAVADRDTYSQLAKMAADDKLKARSPEDYANAVDTISEGKNIYIPAERFNQYFQEQGLDPKDVAESMGAGESLHEAGQTGGAVEIGLGQWLKAVGTEHEAGLRDDVKFTPDGMTVREIAESQKQSEAQAKEDIDRLETFHAEATPESDAGGKKVYTAMRDMMKGLRGFSLAEVNNDPKLYQGFYTALGERLGRDPYELSQEYPLTLKRGEAPKMPSDWMQRKASDQQLAMATAEAGGLTPTRDALLKQGGIEPASLAEAMGSNLSAQDIIELGVGRKGGATFDKAAEALREENGGHLKEGSAAELTQHLMDELTAAKAFKEKHGESLYRRMRGELEQSGGNAEPMYSKLIQTITDKMPDSAPVEQVRGITKDIKEEERKWMGLDEFLDGKDKVSKSELLDFLRANEVQIRDVTLSGKGGETKYESYVLPGGKNYREVLFNLPKAKEHFRGGHFTMQDVLAHVRLDDRTDADGKKVLFVEEIQSDWHQKGRKEGYKGGETPEQAKEFFAIRDEDWAKMSDEQKASYVDDMKGNRGSKVVPDAPFKKTWHEFALKRILRMAAEGGYDKVAWTTGEQQAERYDLSKQVDSVKVEAVEEAPGVHFVDIKVGREDDINLEVENGKIRSGNFEGKDLSDVVGKDLAEKVLAIKPGETKTLSGADLKIGGEGMKGFYDKILPDFARKFGKKYGAEVGESVIGKDKADKPATFKTEDEAGKWAYENAPGRWHVVPNPDSIIYPWRAVDKAGDTLVQSKGAKAAKAHSITITPAMRDAALNEGFSMFQGSDRPRGSYQPDTKTINLFKTADKSTFLHESGHYFLDVLTTEAAKADAPADLKADVKTLREWMGAGPTEALNVSHHEKFARGFEAYLREGNAPSAGLMRAFETFKNWLMNTYKKAVSLNVELSPEVRGVMDRMLATKDEIKRAKDEIGYREFVGEEIEPNLPPALEGKLSDMRAKAHAVAESTIMREQLDEMKASHKAAVEAKRQAETEKQGHVVDAMPVFQAMKDLGSDARKMANRILKDGGKPGDVANFVAAAEIWGFKDVEDLAKAVSEADREKALKAAVDAQMPPDLKDSPELHAKALEAVHGSRMGEVMALEREVLFHLAESQKAKLAEGEAKAQTKAVSEQGQAASKATTKATEKAATDAVKAAFEGWNAKATEAAQIRAKQAVEASRAYATQRLGEKPYQEAGLFKRYLSAERIAARKVGEATAKEDFLAADKAKREQIAAHAMADQAMKNAKTVKSATGYLSGFAGRGQDMKGLPFGFVDKIDRLLADTGLAEPRPESDTMKRLADTLQSEGKEAGEIADATGLVSEGGGWVKESLKAFTERLQDDYVTLGLPDSVMASEGRPQRPLSMSELMDVRDAVKAISTAGKSGKTFLSDVRKAGMKEAGAILSESIKSKVGQPYAADYKLGSPHATKMAKFIDDLKKFPDKAIESRVNVLSLVEFLDKGHDGPAHDYIYRIIKGAEDKERVRQGKMSDDVNAIFEKNYTPKELDAYADTRRYYPEVGTNLTDHERLMMVMNMGNQGNIDRLMRGYGVSREQLDSVVNKASKKDWDTAQAVWDHLETYWPDIARLEMDVRGVEPKQVEHQPIRTVHGDYAGGYFPIAFDYEKSSEAYRTATEKNELYKRESFFGAQTDRGHAKARAKDVKRPIRLNINVLTEHLDNVVHDLEFRRGVIDVSRFLKQPDVRTAIEGAVGIKGKKVIDDWLKRAASDQGEYVDGAEAAMRWFRFKVTFSALGLRMMSLPWDIGGNLLLSGDEVGPRKTYQMFQDYASAPKETHEFVVNNSPRMAQRATMRDMSIMDVNRKWFGGKHGMLNNIKAYNFLFQSLADRVVSEPMWKKVYDDNVAEHGHEKSVHLADEAITRTFGSGSKLDQVGMQQGNEYKKAVSMFYSWNSAMLQRMWSSGKLAGLAYEEGNRPKAMAIMAKSTILMFGLMGLNEAMWREFMRNSQGGDDEAKKKRMGIRLVKQGFGYWGGLTGGLASYAIDKAAGAYTRGYDASSLEGAAQQVVDTAIRGGKALAGTLMDGENHFDAKTTEDILKSGLMAGGLPQQIDAWVFNYMDWLRGQGEATWRDLFSRRVK